ncbi:hypothetical protein P4O66_022384 [Electrophorus voltai]|uniref:Uncharacterized protein n=1 Tax=Electrophorus voltai TaxID=2609070 RepID=A0AAD9E298_9TELE|nr:hypothetical protein P4O66_022384 [Electrophorus voltai]
MQAEHMSESLTSIIAKPNPYIGRLQKPITSRTQTTYQSTPHSRSTAYTTKSGQQDAKPLVAKSERSKSEGAPGWLRVLVFVIVAVFLYYVYSNMESVEKSPFNTIDG